MDGTPEDASLSLRELFCHFSTLESDRQPDAADIEALTKASARQAATIADLKTKVRQLELSSIDQPSIKLSALPDNSNTLRRELNQLHKSPR